MARIITTEKINEIRFYQMPKAFFHNPLYTGMKNESKIAYAILRDLLSLSLDNNWVNDKNEVYVKLSRDKMMKRLNIKGNAKYAEIMKELIEKELIVKRRVGLKQVDETYVCLPEELSVIYSDKELLELENTDVSLKFENQTSRSSKIEPQEVRKSNDKKFENQTHIDTNSLDTNSNDTNTSSSSKGETPDSIHPLVELFNDSICELKKTTTIKFMKYVEKYDKEFIEAIIAYCEERNAKSFSYFQKTIDRYISEDITTVDALNSSIENFKEGNKTKKNNALKAKDEARKEKEFEDTINENILEDMINDKNTAEEAHNKINAGENVNELKELLKKDMTDIQFKTWIAGLDFKLNANELFIVCPNAFTKDILVKRYEYIIKNAVKQAELNVEIEYVVAE